MSTGRVLWIIWCLFWAASWFTSGVLAVLSFFGAPLALLFFPLAILSVVAILIPVGRPARATCPVCGAQGDPALLSAHYQAVHGGGQQRVIGGPQVPPTVIQQPGAQPPIWPTYGPEQHRG